MASDQIGTGSSQVVGADIGPLGFQQDMWQIDGIAGNFPPQERRDSPANFTGGRGPDNGLLGGQAESPEPGGVMGSTVYERRGF